MADITVRFEQALESLRETPAPCRNSPTDRGGRLLDIPAGAAKPRAAKRQPPVFLYRLSGEDLTMTNTIRLAVGLATLTLGAANIGAQTTTPQPPTRLPAARVVGEVKNMLTVQNDRNAAVTVFMQTGGVDRKLGVVPAGAVTSLAIPAAAARGQNALHFYARTQGNGPDLVASALPAASTRQLGLLIPPAGGVTWTDSIAVPLTSEERAAATVTIDNRRNKAMAVYAEQGTYSVKIGEASASGMTTLRLPVSMLRSGEGVRVLMRPAGDVGLSTQVLKLKTGDHVAVEVM